MVLLYKNYILLFMLLQQEILQRKGLYNELNKHQKKIQVTEIKKKKIKKAIFCVFQV